jgi:beta-glucosidase
VQLRLNETLVLPETLGAAAHIDLAKGLHALSATATVSLSAGEVVVEWQRPGGPWEPIPAEVLLRPSLPPVGLTGLYFPNETWSGPPALRRVDWGIGYYWHLTPLPRPYTIEWTGALKAPVTGRYRLGLRARSAATLLVNGREVLTVGPTSGEQYVDLDLAAGLHPVRVRYLDAEGYSFIYLSWIPPGGVPETIPAWALRPW